MARNTRGSVRLGVVEGPLSNPTTVYDLKTGGASLTAARQAQNPNIPIVETNAL